MTGMCCVLWWPGPGPGSNRRTSEFQIHARLTLRILDSHTVRVTAGETVHAVDTRLEAFVAFDQGRWWTVLSRVSNSRETMQAVAPEC